MTLRSDKILIEEVRKHPELFDKYNKNYLNVARKDLIWADISSKLNLEAKKRWNYIRDKYVRNRKIYLQGSGSAASKAKKWPIFPMMAFLDGHIIQKTQKSQDENDDDAEIESTEESLFVDTEVVKTDCTTFTVSTLPLPKLRPLTPSLAPKITKRRPSTPPQSPTARKRKKQLEFDKVHNFFIENLQLFKEHLAQRPREDDEDDLFLRCIKKKMERMNEEEKSKFRIELFYMAEEAVKRCQNV